MLTCIICECEKISKQLRTNFWVDCLMSQYGGGKLSYLLVPYLINLVDNHISLAYYNIIRADYHTSWVTIISIWPTISIILVGGTILLVGGKATKQ